MCEKREDSYLLHALQSLLQEAELLRVRAVLLAPHWLILALLLFEQLHFVPVGIQLAAQRVVLLLQGFGLQDAYRATSGRSPGGKQGRGGQWRRSLCAIMYKNESCSIRTLT